MKPTIILCAILLLIGGCTSRDRALLEHEVVKEQVLDVPIKAQLEQHLVVSGEVTEESLESLLTDLYRAAMRTRGYKYHDRPTSVFIYLYDTKEKATAGQGLWIAMLAKPTADDEPEITVDTKRMVAVREPPAEKSGLSETKRREIFEALVKADDRAAAEAAKKYPLPDPGRPGYSQSAARDQLMKQGEYATELREQYRKDVLSKYGITEEQATQISVEAFDKGWPMPAL